MAQSEETVKSEIKDYVDKSPYSYKEWYVGITDNPRNRLFNEHNVNEKTDYWIYQSCFDSEAARRVEDYFVSILNTQGDTGGGDNKSIFIYAYKITNSTVE